MTVYVIADIQVTDDSWIPDYAAKAHDVVHKHGGRYLARSGNVRVLEGKPLETTLMPSSPSPTSRRSRPSPPMRHMHPSALRARRAASAASR